MLRFLIFSLLVFSLSASPTPPGPLKKISRKLTGSRIINGQRATLGQFPWQVGVRVNGFLSSWFCGGSIIDKEWILTAGHCIEGAVFADVISGSLSSLTDNTTSFRDLILHEDYVSNGEGLANDIGLIRLAYPLNFNANTAAIKLSSEELDAGVEITVSGWGLTSDDGVSISQALNFVELVTISNTDCGEVYGTIGEEMICATSNTEQTKSTCNGDSGGPVVINADSDPVHVAIVSFVSDEGCESGSPSGYTRTATYRDWIKAKTGV